MPLSPPSPEYFSVKGGAKHNCALRLRAGAGQVPPGGAAGAVSSPAHPPREVLISFGFLVCIKIAARGCALPAQELNYL